MKREIKFRAWDSKKKQWINEFHMYSDTGKLVGVNHAYGNIHIMQYTGLKDKNGKEIYEGDIVKTKHCIGTIDYQIQGACYHMNRIDKANHMRYRELMATEGSCDSYSASWCEVIGNIYENPELLK